MSFAGNKSLEPVTLMIMFAIISKSSISINGQRSILYNSVTTLVVQSVGHSVCVGKGSREGGRDFF